MLKHHLLVLPLVASALAQAQLPIARGTPCAQAAAGLAYDVVTIHRSKPSANMNEQSSNMGAGGDRFRASNVPLLTILQFAYDLPEDQIAGLTGPIADAHFDIEAKVTSSDADTPVHLTDHQLQCMVIPLLVDRFHLVTHIETRTRAVYELVVGKSGAKMEHAPDNGKDGSMNTGASNHSWQLNARAETMDDFAAALSAARDRPVLNKTGLTGRYTFKLKWTSEESTETDAGAAPTLVTALQEQLGLKLQPGKGPVETLVVDHVEPPTEN